MTYEQAKNKVSLLIHNMDFEQLKFRRTLDEVIHVCNEAAEVYASQTYEDHRASKNANIINALKQCYGDQ